MRMTLLAASITLVSAICSAAPPQVKFFAPSVGWAGTTDENGTLVKISGGGFSADPKRNTVYFHPNVAAPVLAATPNESQYKFASLHGGPGSGPGALDNPIGLALDAAGKSYVVNVVADAARIEVFGANGQYERRIGEKDLQVPWGVALDDKGHLYVSEQRAGRVRVFTSAGVHQATLGEGTLVSPRGLLVDDKGNVYVADAAKPAVFKIDPAGSVVQLKAPFASPIAVALDRSTKRLYVADQTADAIFVFDNDAYQATWDYSAQGKKCGALGVTDKNGMPLACKPIALAVDPGGHLVVALSGGANLFKLDSAGNVVSKSIPAAFSALGHVAAPISVAADAKRRIYVVDKLCSCIKVFEPTDSQELVARVPPGAQTGRITVQTAAGAGKSEHDFTVLAVGEPPKVDKIEATQGLASYPFVARKDTLVWARLNGIYGHPTRDVATLRIRKPDGKTADYRFDSEDFDYDMLKKETLAKFQVPVEDVLRHEGDYDFEVEFSRDSKRLAAWAETRKVQKSKGLSLLFVKFSDLPESQWSGKNPFPWFDLTAFLEGAGTLARAFPVPPQQMSYRFHPGMYLDFIADGVQDKEKCAANMIDVQLRKILNEFRDNSPYRIDRAVALLDPMLNQTTTATGGKVAGWVCGACAHVQDTANTFFAKGVGAIATWGGLTAHELGHSYGLVPDTLANFDQKNKKGCHSANSTLQNESGAPLDAWNAQSDKLLTQAQAYTMMGAYGSSPPNLNAFFESRSANGDELDYPYLAAKFKNPGLASAGGKSADITSSRETASKRLVMLGGVDARGHVTIDQSFLTANLLPLTPGADSLYAIVFLGRDGRVLAREGFALLRAVDQGESPGGEASSLFSLVTPFPDAATVVQIRQGDRVLTSLKLGDRDPVVRDVDVEVTPEQLVTVRWKATPMHADRLTYSVLYSDDEGRSFIPIRSGLKHTRYTWNASFAPGSSAARIKVIAYDGLRKSGAVSAPFRVPRKGPSAVIASPRNGETIEAGRPITLRGLAVDPEDGALAGSQLSWRLDGTIELGSGDAMRLRQLPHGYANGVRLMMPVVSGRHTVTLLATDSDGNQTAVQSQFEVVPEIGRIDGGVAVEPRRAGGLSRLSRIRMTQDNNR